MNKINFYTWTAILGIAPLKNAQIPSFVYIFFINETILSCILLPSWAWVLVFITSNGVTIINIYIYT